MPDFLWRALLAGVGVALVAGPLGCFVVWRRMAYFGDSLSHSALLGVALGLLAGIDVTFGVITSCIVVALFLVGLERQKRWPVDTLLVILSHSALSVGLVVIGFAAALRVDLMSYLFGDILAVSRGDLLWIYGGGAVVLGALIAIWRPLLSTTVHEELARAEGVPVERMRLIFVLLIALAVALAMKVIGVLLVSALLIIPAATARRFARTPEQMAFTAAALGCIAVALGLGASLRFDTPGGPSIVVAAALLFAIALALGPVVARRARV